MSWHTGRLACFDIESTGVDAFRDRIVTSSVVGVGGGRPTQTHEWLCNPGIPIPAGATEVHGITDAQATFGGVDPADAVQAIAQLLIAASTAGVPIVGHNVVYDLTMLWAECLRHRHDALAKHLLAIRPVIDTSVLDKWVDPYRPKAPTNRRKDPATCGSRNLTDTCRVWGITLTEEDAHGATADALAAGRLAWVMAHRTPGLQMPLGELHAEQIEWKREQAESLQAYFDRQGRTEHVATQWPLQPPPPGWSPDQLPTPPEETEQP